MSRIIQTPFPNEKFAIFGFKSIKHEGVKNFVRRLVDWSTVDGWIYWTFVDNHRGIAVSILYFNPDIMNFTIANIQNTISSNSAYRSS